MSHRARSTLAALFGAALMLGGCDRLPHRSSPSAVTVRLPPPRIAAPGFAIQDGPKAAPVALRETTGRE